jgi:hypothetical protein
VRGAHFASRKRDGAEAVSQKFSAENYL